MSGDGTPGWARWSSSGDEFRLGIEEEVMLLDPVDWRLDQGWADLRGRLDDPLALRMSSETHASTIEYATEPHHRAAYAATELRDLRASLVDALAEHGRAAASAGTHPFVRWEETEVSPDRRYRYLHRTLRELARREPTYAMHVHVSIGSAELAVETANRMRVHLPLLLALSANSPFWQGRDTGLASARTAIFQAFPRVGIPRVFDGYADYVGTLRTLIDAGAFPAPNFVWWDLRLQPSLGTLEIRAMDAQTEVWRAEALAALTQSLVRLEALDARAPGALISAPELLDENRFRAARDGARAQLLDPVGLRLLPVDAVAELAVEAAREHARDLGCEAELDRVPDLVAEPADGLQRALARDADLAEVVRALSERFSSSAPTLDRSPERSVAPPRSR